CEIGRPRRFELEDLAAYRMLERQTGRVQHLPCDAEFWLAGAIRCVADDWMADRGAMDANLMRAAGFQPEVQQAEVERRTPETLAHAIVRHRRAAVAAHRKLRSRALVASDRRFDRAGTMRRHAPDDGIVAAA